MSNRRRTFLKMLAASPLLGCSGNYTTYGDTGGSSSSGGSSDNAGSSSDRRCFRYEWLLRRRRLSSCLCPAATPPALQRERDEHWYA